MSIVYDGRRYEVPGVPTESWADDPARIPRVTFAGTRRAPIRAIVLHSTAQFAPTEVRPGSRAPANRYFYARYVVENANADGSPRASWDATALTDGTVLWHTDPATQVAWASHDVNPYTVGIEIAQGPQGEVYADQLAAVVRLVDFLTALLGIQRQIPWHDGAPDRRVLPRLHGLGMAGVDVSGVYGHRNVSPTRDDPGDVVWPYLKAAGYETFDFAAGEDKRVWAERQRQLGVAADGVPLAQTVAALRAAGYRDGIYAAGKGGGVLPWLLAGAAALGLAWWGTRR